MHAAKLGATLQHAALPHGGRRCGSDAFIAQHFQKRCDRTCAQIDKLVGLTLNKALPFRGAMGLEAPASLARLQEALPAMKHRAESPDYTADRAAIRKARPCGWQPCSGRAPMRTPAPAQPPSLQGSKQMLRGPVHRLGLRLLQTSPACAVAPARWRQHGSQHCLARRSLRL